MIEILDNTRSFAQVETEWNRLAERMSAPLLRHEWFMAAAVAFHSNQLLQVVVVRGPDGQITAAAPLVLSRRFPGPRLELIGCTRLYEPSGYLFEDPASLHLLHEAVNSLGRPVVLGRAPAVSSFARLPQMGRSRPLAVSWSRQVSGAPFIRLGMKWNEYVASLPSRRRSNLRRRRRLADEIGPVEVMIVKPTLEQLPQLLGALIRVESAGWKGGRGSAIGVNPEMRAFISNYAESSCRVGTLRIGLLTIGGQPAAALLGIESGAAFFQLKLGYDEAFANCSPAVLLMHSAIEHACEAGLTRFEILGVDETWKRQWTQDVHPMSSTMYYPLNATGVAAFLVDLVMSAAGAARRVYRTWISVAKGSSKDG